MGWKENVIRWRMWIIKGKEGTSSMNVVSRDIWKYKGISRRWRIRYNRQQCGYSKYQKILLMINQYCKKSNRRFLSQKLLRNKIYSRGISRVPNRLMKS